MSKKEIRDCPICRCKVNLCWRPYDDTYNVECDTRKHMTPRYETEKDAITAWNAWVSDQTTNDTAAEGTSLSSVSTDDLLAEVRRRIVTEKKS